MGFKLFAHSVGMVLGHLGPALRISGLLYLGYIALSLPFLLSAQAGQLQGGPLFLGVVGLLLTVVLVFWIAVGWHRFVLLDESPGAFLPRFRGGHILTYFGCTLLVFLTSLPVLLGAVVALIAASALSLPVPLALALSFAFPVAALVAVLVIGYRFSAILPATAVDRPLPMGQAWAATDGATGAMLVLAVISAVAAYLIDLPAAMLVSLPWGNFAAFAWLAITGWFKLMVGVSILTVIYGHYVEHRPLG